MSEKSDIRKYAIHLCASYTRFHAKKIRKFGKKKHPPKRLLAKKGH